MRRFDVELARLQMETAGAKVRLEARDKAYCEFDKWLDLYYTFTDNGLGFWEAMVKVCEAMEAKGKNEAYINEACEFIEELV